MKSIGYIVVLPILVCTIFVCTIFACTSSSVLAGNITDAQRQQALIHLLLADCGSCHGITLKGGLGPSLLATDLSVKPDTYLFEVIRNGIPGTPMPPWAPFMSDDEIHWMIKQLRNEKWRK